VSETHPGAFRVPFVKASACGNDFLLVEERFAPVDLADFTRRACDRHDGVGADGVEWLAADDDADIAARLLNADGSAAEISGNGTRCVAALVASRTQSTTPSPCAPAPASASASSCRGATRSSSSTSTCGRRCSASRRSSNCP